MKAKAEAYHCYRLICPFCGEYVSTDPDLGYQVFSLEDGFMAGDVETCNNCGADYEFPSVEGLTKPRRKRTK